MSLVRGMAEGISRFVVRHASPGSREWAEGLAREADFVESDWKALAWSLGSTRVLLSYREAPLRSMEDLSSEAEKYAERMRHRFGSTKGRLIADLLQTALWTVNLLTAKQLQDRLGYFLAVLGAVALTIHVLLLSRKGYDVPDRGDSEGMITYYKTGLERASSFNTLSFMAVVSFTLFVGAGFVIVSISRFFEFLLGFAWVALIVLFVHKRESNLRRLAEIATLLRERN